jgi:hypothetical protein
MNAKQKIIIVMGLSSLAALPLMAGPAIVVQIPAPVLTVHVPAPAPPVVTVDVAVPDTYVWDGAEFVGVVGNQYYYLGAGNVWLPFDAVRVARWHDWERVHADWRAHAIANVRYRHDAHGHVVPGHDDQVHDMSHDNHDNDGHDKDHDHDH